MLIRLYEDSPSKEGVEQVVEALRNGGVVIYPTDTLYGIGCAIDNTRAVERIIQIKGMRQKDAQFSFICESLSQVSEFARISDENYHILRKYLPGPFTFILPGLNRVPSYFISRRKTVGIRIPDHSIPCALVRELGIPILTTSLPVGDSEVEYSMYPELMLERWGHCVDMIIDCGVQGHTPSTVVDCTGDTPSTIRQGKGEFSD